VLAREETHANGTFCYFILFLKKGWQVMLYADYIFFSVSRCSLIKSLSFRSLALFASLFYTNGSFSFIAYLKFAEDHQERLIIGSTLMGVRQGKVSSGIN
jgi:hypothetical protein